jgi:hypothetical protein
MAYERQQHDTWLKRRMNRDYKFNPSLLLLDPNSILFNVCPIHSVNVTTPLSRIKHKWERKTLLRAYGPTVFKLLNLMFLPCSNFTQFWTFYSNWWIMIQKSNVYSIKDSEHFKKWCPSSRFVSEILFKKVKNILSFQAIGEFSPDFEAVLVFWISHQVHGHVFDQLISIWADTPTPHLRELQGHWRSRVATEEPVGPGLHFILPTENFVAGALQGFTGRATCSPATAGAAKAGTDQASPGRRHDISINSISAAPPQ